MSLSRLVDSVSIDQKIKYCDEVEWRRPGSRTD